MSTRALDLSSFVVSDGNPPATPPKVSETDGQVSDVVARAARGDRTAFEEIYREEAGRVYALCLRLTGDRVRAGEHTQDVFVRAWDRLKSFRGEAALSSWLHRLTVNVVLESQRTERRRRRRVEPMGDDLPESPSGLYDHAVRMDLEQAIAGLPTAAREVFVLHDVEGYKHTEVAGALGIAEGTSKAHLHRARQLLREALGR